MSSDLKSLVCASKNGDEEAIHKLITMYKNLIFTLIFRTLNDYDLSMDLCQETFIQAFLKINKLKDEEKFKPWLCKIALNLSRNELKKKERERIHRSFFLRKERVEVLRKSIILNEALGKLNEKDRKILILHYYKGFTLKEISEISGLKEENLKMALSRARMKLRQKLEGQENELLS